METHSIRFTRRILLALLLLIDVGNLVFAQENATESSNVTSQPTSSPSIIETVGNTTALPPDFINVSETLSIYETVATNNLIVATLAESASLRPILDNAAANLTLFAPINQAFESLDSKILAYLQHPDNIRFLRHILLGHVAQGSLSTEDLGQLTNIMVENGATRKVRVNTNGEIFIDFALVLNENIQATNGVIHLVDSLVNVPTFPQVMELRNEFILQSLTDVGLVNEMDGKTFFGPGLFALAELPESLQDLSNAMLSDPSFNLHLTELFRAHILPDIVLSSEFQDGDTVTMINGDNFTVTVLNDTISLFPGTRNGFATVVAADVLTQKTILHQIGGLLYASFFDVSLLEIASQYTTTLANLVVKTEMDGVLMNSFNLTVFAPTNAAFDRLSPSSLEYFQTEAGIPSLKAILQYHVAAGVYSSNDLKSIENEGVPSLYRNGAALIQVSRNNQGAVILNGKAFVEEVDVLANNGIAHVIDTVLMLPALPPPTEQVPSDPTPAPTSPTPQPQTSGATWVVFSRTLCLLTVVIAAAP